MSGNSLGGVRAWRQTLHWSLQDEAKVYYVTDRAYPVDEPAFEYEPGQWLPQPRADAVAAVVQAARGVSLHFAMDPLDWLSAVQILDDALAALDATEPA